LVVAASDMEQMRAQISQQAPEEACGLLAGTALEGVGQVKIAIPVSNALHSHVRFRMAAEEQLAAFLHIEELGFELLAIYHSHPHGPASPSRTDLAEAFYPEALTLIWSGQTGEWLCRAFTIRNGESYEVPLLVEG